MATTYEAIKPLIVEESISGSRLNCKFKAPNSSSVIQSSVSAYEFQSNKSKMLSTAKTEFITAVLYYLRTVLQRFLGYQAGWSASNVLDRGLNGQANIVLSNEEKQMAVVKAFETVANQFEWKNDGWVLKSENPG